MRKEKRLLPILITIFLWGILAFLFYFIDPNTFAILPLFFFLTLLALFFTFSIVLKNRRRGIIIAFGITIFLIFRVVGIGNIINLFLIIAIAITIEVYFWYTKSP